MKGNESTKIRCHKKGLVEYEHYASQSFIKQGIYSFLLLEKKSILSHMILESQKGHDGWMGSCREQQSSRYFGLEPCSSEG